jgi:hypothetical protein
MRGTELHGAPRNMPLYEQGQALRREICDMLQCHSPIAPPLTAKLIRGRLSKNRRHTPSLRAIQWHVRAIRGAIAAHKPDWRSATNDRAPERLLTLRSNKRGDAVAP